MTQDYYERVCDEHGIIHATKDFEEPMTEYERMVITHAYFQKGKCRYCEARIRPDRVTCPEHAGQYRAWRRKAVRQARRLCELARAKRMVTTGGDVELDSVTT